MATPLMQAVASASWRPFRRVAPDQVAVGRVLSPLMAPARFAFARFAFMGLLGLSVRVARARPWLHARSAGPAPVLSARVPSRLGQRGHSRLAVTR